MVTREWRCGYCSEQFESEEPLCPVCKSEENVRREIRTAPAVQTSGRRQFMDKQMTELATEYGFTDMSNKTGSVAGDARQRRMANVVDTPQLPDAIQSLVDAKMKGLVDRYRPPTDVKASDKPTPVVQKPLGNDASTVPVMPHVRPGPGTLRHPDDLKK